MDLKIKILKENAVKPEYATKGSAGMDLVAATDGAVTLKSGGRALISTGIAMQIPQGYAGFIFPRSGLAHKKGISMSNCVGVIDSDYTGEIMVSLHNIADHDYIVNTGDRVAQMVIMPIAMADIKIVEELDKTDRGDGGFGSTGR